MWYTILSEEIQPAVTVQEKRKSKQNTQNVLLKSKYIIQSNFAFIEILMHFKHHFNL